MAQATFTQAFNLDYAADFPMNDGGEERPYIQEGATQSYDRGDPLYFDSAGQLALMTVSSNKTSALAGFADADATGVQATPAAYTKINSGDRYVMNLKPSGGGSQATALTYLGDVVNFDLDTSIGNYLVANPTSADRTKPYGVIEGFWTSDAFPQSTEEIGDLNGHVVVRMYDYIVQ